MNPAGTRGNDLVPLVRGVTPADLRREVIARHAPELLLAQQQMRQQRRPEA